MLMARLDWPPERQQKCVKHSLIQTLIQVRNPYPSTYNQILCILADGMGGVSHQTTSDHITWKDVDILPPSEWNLRWTTKKDTVMSHDNRHTGRQARRLLLLHKQNSFSRKLASTAARLPHWIWEHDLRLQVGGGCWSRCVCSRVCCDAGSFCFWK